MPPASRHETNPVEIFWEKHKRKALVGVLLLPVLFVAFESLCTMYFAHRVREASLPRKSFERLFLSHTLYPDFAQSEWEKKWGIRVRAGDELETYNSSLGFQRDTLLPWRARPGSAIIRFRNPVFVNSQGFVSIRNTGDFLIGREKPPGKYRVLVVGGSTVYGIGAEPTQTVPAWIEAGLQSKFGPERVEVYNAGVGGYTSSEELLYLVSELVYYHPDLVIVYDGWNDVHFHNYRSYLQGKSWFPLRAKVHDISTKNLDTSFQPLHAAADLARTLLFCLKHEVVAAYEGLAFVQLARESAFGIAGLRAQVEKLEKWLYFYDPSDLTHVPYEPRIADAYRDNLQLMRAVARHFGFRIAFFFQPYMGPSEKPFTPEEERIFQTMDKYDVESRVAFARDAATTFRDLRKEFRGSRDAYAEDISQVFKGVKERTFFYTGHLNGEGNRLVAARIVDSILKLNWITK